jgi:DNA-directed RNA polymerase subunit RPC12/RpoP
MYWDQGKNENQDPFADFSASWTGKDISWEPRAGDRSECRVVYLCGTCGKELVEARPGSGVIHCCGQSMEIIHRPNLSH